MQALRLLNHGPYTLTGAEFQRGALVFAGEKAGLKMRRNILVNVRLCSGERRDASRQGIEGSVICVEGREEGGGLHVGKRRVHDPRRAAINFFLKSAFVRHPRAYYARASVRTCAQQKKKKRENK